MSVTSCTRGTGGLTLPPSAGSLPPLSPSPALPPASSWPLRASALPVASVPSGKWCAPCACRCHLSRKRRARSSGWTCARGGGRESGQEERETQDHSAPYFICLTFPSARLMHLSPFTVTPTLPSGGEDSLLAPTPRPLTPTNSADATPLTTPCLRNLRISFCVAAAEALAGSRSCNRVSKMMTTTAASTGAARMSVVLASSDR